MSPCHLQRRSYLRNRLRYQIHHRVIQLGENVLGRPGDLSSVPYGLRNNSAVYSDQVRVRMGNLRITELDPSNLEQIRSDSPLQHHRVGSIQLGADPI